MSNLRHGMRGSRVYGVWVAMLARCSNPKVKSYSYYGGRGITVCEKWNDFAAFIEDMGIPEEWQQIDRIDNNKGYNKENCRWANRIEQARNKRSTRMLTIDGSTKSMAEWSELSGIKLQTIWARISKGWSEKNAVFHPLSPCGKGLKKGEKYHHHAFGAENDVKWSEK